VKFPRATRQLRVDGKKSMRILFHSGIRCCQQQRLISRFRVDSTIPRM